MEDFLKVFEDCWRLLKTVFQDAPRNVGNVSGIVLCDPEHIGNMDSYGAGSFLLKI